MDDTCYDVCPAGYYGNTESYTWELCTEEWTEWFGKTRSEWTAWNSSLLYALVETTWK